MVEQICCLNTLIRVYTTDCPITAARDGWTLIHAVTR